MESGYLQTFTGIPVLKIEDYDEKYIQVTLFNGDKQLVLRENIIKN